MRFIAHGLLHVILHYALLASFWKERAAWKSGRTVRGPDPAIVMAGGFEVYGTDTGVMQEYLPNTEETDWKTVVRLDGN